MSKNYGSFVTSNTDAIPTNSEQEGVWNTTEQYRQAGQVGIWPVIQDQGNLQVPVGSVLFALSPTAVTRAIAGFNFLVPSGQGLQRSEYPQLYDAYQYSYGGAGEIFNLPNYCYNELYLKASVASGANNVAEGPFDSVVPLHTHNVNGMGGSFAGVGRADGPCKRDGDNQNSNVGNSSGGNTASGPLRAAHKKVYPLLVCRPNQTAPYGVAYALNLPLEQADIGGILNADADNPSNEGLEPVLVPSGQLVSRAVQSGTFVALGEYYGAGDGATTYQLPDLRAAFLEMSQPFNFINQIALGQDRLPSHQHNYTMSREQKLSDAVPGASCTGNQNETGAIGGPATSSTFMGTGTENRPPNFTTYWIMKGGNPT